MPRSLALALFVLAVGLSSASCVSPIHETAWTVVQTKRFEIFTTLRDADARALATELERFHALVYAVTNAPRVEPPVPTRIYALRRAQYASVGPRGTAGVMQPGLRDNVILLSDYSQQLGAAQVVLHEYTHFVLRNGLNRPYPVWYDEGLAEFFSTVLRHDERTLVLGAIPKARIPWFQHGKWISMERILAARSYDDLGPDELGMFYAEAWALVHYLTLDREPGSPAVSTGLKRYIDLVESGTPTDRAYREAFGELPSRSGKRIRSLLDDGTMKVIGISIEKLDFDRSEPVVRRATPSEAALHLAQLHLRKRDGERAEKALLGAIEASPDEARLHAAMGDALKFQSRFDEALPHFERAVELGPSDALNHLDLAEFWDDRAREKATSVEALRADLEKARKHYRAALELDPDLPETLAMLGATHLAPGESATLGMGYLGEAFKLMPASSFLLARLAEAHLAIGDEDSARKFLLRLHAVRGEGGRRFSMDDQIAEIRKQRAEAAERVGAGEPAT